MSKNQNRRTKNRNVTIAAFIMIHLVVYVALTMTSVVDSVANAFGNNETTQTVASSSPPFNVLSNQFITTVPSVSEFLAEYTKKPAVVEVVKEPEIVKEVEPTIEEAPPVVLVVTSDWLNVRSEGHHESNIINTLKFGTPITVKETLENGWIEIEDGGYLNPKYTIPVADFPEFEKPAVAPVPKKEVTALSYKETPVKEVMTNGNVISPVKNGILTKSNVTVDHVKDLVDGTKLAGTDFAESVVEAESKHGVNALFIIAVARLESGNGSSKIARDKNNLFGLNAIDGAAYKNAFSYDSQGGSVEAFAKLIKNKYIDKGYDTMDKIGKRYASNTKWSQKVKTLVAKDFKELSSLV